MKVSSRKTLLYFRVVVKTNFPLESHVASAKTRGSSYQPCQSMFKKGFAKKLSKFIFAAAQFQSSPSWNFTPVRNVKVMLKPSALSVQLVAKAGTIEPPGP